jgi:hypothetical protein
VILPGVIASSGGVASSFESIATVTVGSGGSSGITFSSIPQTFSHLQIRGIGRGTTTNPALGIVVRFNGDTGSNYVYHAIVGTGASAVIVATTGASFMDLFENPSSTSTANAFSGGVCDILDYSVSTKYKTARSLNGYDRNGAGEIFLFSGLWRNTAAITQIDLIPYAALIAEYSSFALYGVKG